MARLSTKPRPYLCQACNKTYITKYDLRRHAKVHLTGAARDKEMHRCPMNNCSFETFQRSNLKVHINVIHLRLQNLVCHECKPAYQTGDPANMTRHKIKKHGQISTEKKRSRNKGKMKLKNSPVVLKSDSDSPSLPLSALPPLSPPASPSLSVETAPEPRLFDDDFCLDSYLPAASHSSLSSSGITPQPILCPRLPSIFDGQLTSVPQPDEPSSSSNSLPPLSSLGLPRPPLQSSLDSPFLCDPRLDPIRTPATSTHYNHLRRGSEWCMPPRPIHSYNNDRRHSESHLITQSSHRRSPSLTSSISDSPPPKFSDPFQPGRESHLPASSSSTSRASSVAPSFSLSPLFQPQVQQVSATFEPRKWIVTVPSESANDTDEEINVRFLGSNIVSTRRQSRVWPTPGA
ncbi:hypothetical protein DFS33DRAFT_128916 [Desarmillaria ectypa]|nr:hypothetical protein DFS33DRAFT_128916 [Desarmillaria ectypa]